MRGKCTYRLCHGFFFSGSSIKISSLSFWGGGSKKCVAVALHLGQHYYPSPPHRSFGSRIPPSRNPPPRSPLLIVCETMSSPHPTASELTSIATLVTALLHTRYPTTTLPRTLPDQALLQAFTSTLLSTLPGQGLGVEPTLAHLHPLSTLHAPLSAHYHGFVTGHHTPAALAADLLATLLDTNVHLHLPLESAATAVTAAALRMLLDLFSIPRDAFAGRVFTTGATGSNILALAAAREHLAPGSAARGFTLACVSAGRPRGVEVLTAGGGHSSIAKAAAVLGLGRESVRDLGDSAGGRPWMFELRALEERLRRNQAEGRGSVVVVNAGEVNTGRFEARVAAIRDLADRFGSAWVHVDAAFGLFARLLPRGGAEEAWVAGLERAHSIAGDGHKLLQVPYDCGFLFVHSPTLLAEVCKNVAPYLQAGGGGGGSRVEESPLNTHLENSARFRGLPVYATLATYGKEGYEGMMRAMVAHARGIARVVLAHEGYELLPREEERIEEEERVRRVFIVVLFRARDEGLNRVLKERINAGGMMYVSGTEWDGRPAVRCAVSNWMASAEKEGPAGWGMVEEVLDEVAESWAM
jgi:glutamate/tyrosine decarboxylase-like PLP-dependent enzyme